MAHGRQGGVLFANSFSFYPWMLDRNFEDLIGTTPAMLGIHEVAKFRGQCSPEVPDLRITEFDIDEPLRQTLLERWRRWSSTDSPLVEDVALFRSLNMALHASMLPAGTDASFYDQGRLIALWISAFEILVHPGGAGKADRFKVFDLLERVQWERRACKDRKYLTKAKGKEEKENRTLASWLYEILYRSRNDFLHGNPVTVDSLKLPDSGASILGTRRRCIVWRCPRSCRSKSGCTSRH